MQNSNKPQRKDVATAVLLHKGKILILRRSDKVGTHQGKWACVSGFIEEKETPYETALKEIKEELDLKEDDIKLLREGEVIFALEEDYLWAVHPFLFYASSQNITLDWEHEESRWIHPDDIENYETVPELDRTIRSLIRKEDLESEL